jgi:hypothetical protein
MSQHRHPPDSLSNDVPPHNPETPDAFDPAAALESLHLEIVQLEALANAAGEAVVQLPFPSGREARRVFDRVYALVNRVADETTALVAYGDELVAELAVYLKARPPEG